MHVIIPALHRATKPTGVCRHAANLAKCLAETDNVHKVTLILGDWQVQYFRAAFQLLSPKIDIVGIPIKNSSFSRNYWFIFGLPKLANSLQPDIIHVSFPLPFIRQWFKAPIVATIHDLYPYECPENFGYPQVWLNQLFLRQCIDQSDGLCCVSQATRDSLCFYFKNLDLAKPVTVIYNYVDFSHIISEEPQGVHFEDSASFILSVAQHRKNKNLDLLIDAYHRLYQSGLIHTETKLLIVGSSGPETQNILQQVETLGLEERVIFQSSVNDNELCWFYEHCALFVIPSSQEGFCLPLVEAISLAPNVICSNIPIFKEVAASHANFFELGSQSVENLADCIAKTLAQPASEQQMVDPRFTKDHVTHQLLAFYAAILPKMPSELKY
jgi:glycosyltransferase involved in cell wall biosynthesis